MRHTIIYYTLSILLIGALQACTKNLSNTKTGNLPTYNDIANSSTRIVNAPGLDLMVDTTKLTNFLPFNVELNQSPPNGTPFFPTTGATTNAFYIPQEFIDSKGQATIRLFARGTSQSSVPLDSFVIRDNYSSPNDYYVPGSGFGYLGYAVVPRPPQTLTDPTHIRIRLLNLAASTGDAYTLAYADGTPVSNATSHLKWNAWSDYIEIPYGSYAFRVLRDTVLGWQLDANPPAGEIFGVGSPVDPVQGGGQYYTPTITFQPGGVYTILVAVNLQFQYNFSPAGFPCFSVITDNSPTANRQYARIQAVNSSASNGMNLEIDNGGRIPVAYGKASDYQLLTSGSHDIKIDDGSGNFLAEQAIDLSGGDNISLWTYADANGKTTIVPVSNNMGALHQYGTNSDGSDPSIQIADPLSFGLLAQTRFLNLCPDLPYVTFTADNGNLFPDNRFSTAAAAQNLAPGIPADPVTIPYPYIALGPGSTTTIEAYRSQPNVLPGNRLTNITPLQPAAFAALPASWYPQDSPTIDPGVYTVALIGRNNSTQNPQLIVIKHNK